LKCFFWINKYNTQNKKAITNSFQTRFKQTISRMNSSVENTVVVTKAPRTPTLAAKYSKFMAFGYWITSQLVEKAILTEAQRDSVFENLAIFQSLDEQVAFYEGFLKTSCGPSTKAIKKLVAAKNKPPKAPRAKKTKAVAEKQDDLIAKLIADANDGGEGAAPVEAAPKKKAAAKKSKKTEPVSTLEAATEGAVVAEEPVAPVEAKKKAAPKKSKKTEPVATLDAATEGFVAPLTEGSTDVATADVVTAEAEPKKKAAPKKSKKTEAATEGSTAVAEVVATEPKKKAAPKKSKKTETVATEEPVAAPVEPVAEEGDEDIIQTRVVAIADKEYLIDSQNNLYTIQEPHDNIGSYDPASGNVSFRPSYAATAAC
jgi:hypothetical protein